MAWIASALSRIERAALLAVFACAIAVGSLTSAIPAQASLPLIATDGASATGATSARVEGNGDPEGQETMLHADYALAGELWCTSHGMEGNPSETAPQSLGSGNAMYSEILVGLEGLSPLHEYCVELVAHNDAGSTYGGQVKFTTQSSLPVVSTDGAWATGATTARVEGNADAEGQSTILHADYALASEPWCASGGAQGTPVESAPTDLGASFAMFSEIVVKLEGLTPGSEYCAELVGHNKSGTTYGGQRRFKTLSAVPPSPPRGSGGGPRSESKEESAQPAAEKALSLTPPSTIATVATSKPKPLTKAQKLAKALKVCAHKPRRQRTACRARAHEKYGRALGRK